MGNMLFKTNRTLFVRFCNFNLPRKVDSYKEILNFLSFLDFLKTVSPNYYFTFLKMAFYIFFSCCFFFFFWILPCVFLQYIISVIGVCYFIFRILQFRYIFGFPGKLLAIFIQIIVITPKNQNKYSLFCWLWSGADAGQTCLIYL